MKFPLQFVWWGLDLERWRIAAQFVPKDIGWLHAIYVWAIQFGPIEIRRWRR